MLDLRPNCECCDRDLAPDSKDARICTYECTFCADCVETKLKGTCPNCGGNLVPRPVRALVARVPGLLDRVFERINESGVDRQLRAAIEARMPSSEGNAA